MPRAVYLPLILAALAMVATLPGRTHGLGLVTEPLLADLALDRVTFGYLNLWATLIGAAFCLPCGWLIDRIGGRVVLLVVTLGLSAAVLGVARAETGWGDLLLPGLFLLILLTRGLGQSALSVVSLAVMGRTVGRSGFAVGLYSVIVGVGFMAAFSLIRACFRDWHLGWREVWAGISLAVAAFGVVAALLLTRYREVAESADVATTGATLTEALRSPAFWVFAGAMSLYGLVSAGISLFNESILKERGFDRDTFLTITAFSPLIGLAANLATGGLASRVPLHRLLVAAMALMAAALAAYPFVETLEHVYAYAVVWAAAGGMVTVLFFAAWRRGYGTAHLGAIQGAAQMATVLASAVGPALFAEGQRAFGSYVPVFQWTAVAAGLFALAACLAPLPRPESGD